MNKITLLSLIIIILYGCKSEEPNYPVPDPVVMVAKSPDTSAVEQGIDAVPEYDGIQLQWYRLPERGIESYNIYRKSPDDTYFKRIAAKKIDDTQASGSDTTFLDTSVVVYQDYFYYITATSKDNKEGMPGDTVSYRLLEKALTIYPDGQLNIEGLPVFQWNTTDKPDLYILRIERDFDNKLCFIKIVQTNYLIEMETYDPGESEADSIEFFSEVIPGSGITYKWRIDCMGDDSPIPSGSESEWKYFGLLSN
jgi:hypothetical protein